MKKVGLIAGGIVLALIVGLVVVRQVAIGYLTPDFLVQQIESRWKCRAHIETVEAKILGTATIELKGVALGKRDVYARKKTPLADRPPLEGAEISSDSVLLEVRPLPLIRRQLDIRRLSFQGADVETAIRRTGKLSIARLFETPGEGGGKQTAPSESPAVETVATETVTNESVPAGATPPTPTPSEEPVAEGKFNADSIPVAMVADRIEVSDTSVAVQIDASGARITLENVQFGFMEIDVDPDDLATHNRTAFQFEGGLIVQPKEEDVEFVRAKLSGAGIMRPFDPVTGEINPSISTDLTIHSGTQLNTFPVVEKVKEMLDNVDAAGIEFGDFNLGGELMADANTRIAYEQPKLFLEKPLRIELPDTTLVMNAESWMDTGSNQHDMKGLIMASDELTAKIEGMVDAYLKKKAGSFASPSLRDTILSPLKTDDRIALEVVSQGDLGNPKADIITPLGNLTEVIDTGKMLKDSLEEAGKSFLKGLLGGEKEKP